jgi:hypothetical protein
MRNDMPSGKEKATEFRKQAATCFELAKQLSLNDHKARMIEHGEELLELARLAEAENELPDDTPKDPA